MPVTGVACLLGALSLVGIPPLNGFWSEWLILRGGVASGNILVAAIASFSTLITAGYYLWFAWRVFFGAVPEELAEVQEASWMQRLPIIILAAACIVFGLFPSLMLTFLTPAAEYLSTFLQV
jgi:formate hydrogenlyase subunit 3/multisubunit Na+/H+ antiporter MnhD subunit